AMDQLLGSNETKYNTYVELAEATDVLVEEESGERVFIVRFEETTAPVARKSYHDLLEAIENTELACGKLVKTENKADGDLLHYICIYHLSPLYAVAGSKYEDIQITVSVLETSGKNSKTGAYGDLFRLSFRISKSKK
ncbi:MAG: hypothetical protein AAFV80_12505, partial [Bacteroidota bacterium]